jgi:hypothetical protein
MDGICCLLNLSQLFLDHNKIASVSSEINQCATLRVLSLASNQLSEYPHSDKSRMPSLNLGALTKLDLHENELTTLRFAEALESLTELCVASNSIVELSLLPDLGKLEILDLRYDLLPYNSHNRLKTIEHISCFPRLKEFNISFNLIKDRDLMLTALFKLTVLEKLDARQNVFNSQYHLASQREETESYRYALVYNFSQTLTLIDGVVVTNDERIKTFQYVTQNARAESQHNTRLFKLTETLDTQLLDLRGLMDSAKPDRSTQDPEPNPRLRSLQTSATNMFRYAFFLLILFLQSDT